MDLREIILRFQSGQNISQISDSLGKEIKTLINEKQTPGIYQIEFNASKFSSGIYLHRLQSGDFVQTKKLILIK